MPINKKSHKVAIVMGSQSDYSTMRHSENVLKKEIIGYKIINSLLKNITTAALNKFHNKETSYDKLILRLIPKNHPIIDKKSIYKTSVRL